MSLVFKCNLIIDIENIHWYQPHVNATSHIDDKSTFVQSMARRRKAIGHYQETMMFQINVAILRHQAQVRVGQKHRCTVEFDMISPWQNSPVHLSPVLADRLGYLAQWRHLCVYMFIIQKFGIHLAKVNVISDNSCSAYLYLHFRYRINSSPPGQNGLHFTDDIFKRIFLNENVWMSIKISLKFVPKGPINNTGALVQIMASRRPGDNPLSEPMMVSLPTHICVTELILIYFA